MLYGVFAENLLEEHSMDILRKFIQMDQSICCYLLFSTSVGKGEGAFSRDLP